MRDTAELLTDSDVPFMRAFLITLVNKVFCKPSHEIFVIHSTMSISLRFFKISSSILFLNSSEISTSFSLALLLLRVIQSHSSRVIAKV